MFYIVTHFRASKLCVFVHVKIYLVSENQENVSNVGENLNIISLFLSINSRKKKIFNINHLTEFLSTQMGTFLTNLFQCSLCKKINCIFGS